MSLHRLPEPPRRSRRLLVCGMAAAFVVVPGVAHAESSPLDPVTQQLEDAGQAAVDAVTGDSLPGGAGGLGDVLPSAGTGTGTGAGTGTGTGADPDAPGGAGGATSPVDPAEVQALLGQLGVSPECATAVQGDVEALLASVPETVEELAAQLQTELTDALETPPSSAEDFQALLMGAIGQVATAADPDGLPVLTAVQDLVTDFLANCLPEPPAPTSTTPPPAAPTSAAPVAYLGYAPTGADEDTDDDGGLALLGGVLLLSGAAAGTWMWSRRAASSRG